MIWLSMRMVKWTPGLAWESWVSVGLMFIDVVARITIQALSNLHVSGAEAEAPRARQKRGRYECQRRGGQGTRLTQ